MRSMVVGAIVLAPRVSANPLHRRSGGPPPRSGEELPHYFGLTRNTT